MNDPQSDHGALQVPENLFQNMKFFVTGKVPDRIIELLTSGGGQHSNYFLDYCTHLICGENPSEAEIGEANDIYEIPAITIKWMVMCCRLRRLVSTKPYVHNFNKLFTNMTFSLSRLGRDSEPLWAIITYHGGSVQLNFDSQCTHLITVDTSTAKYEKASTLGSDRVKIVTPDWILESVRSRALAQVDLFHPRLIQWPKVIKHESTTAITGFEPEKSESGENLTGDSVADSTQALLDKLKSRMPWNQPATSAVTSTVETVAPPNVVAPSYLSKQPQITPPQQQQQQVPAPPVARSFSQPQLFPQQVNQQIPRSIVHHTPQSQIQQVVSQQQQQPQQLMQQPQQPNLGLNPNQMHLNRLIGQQAPPRPNIQQLRGQLGANQQQLHQQLLQQRIAQQNQQNNQQRSINNIQQQLLQQQLAQQQQQNQLGPPARQLQMLNQQGQQNQFQQQPPQHLVQQQLIQQQQQQKVFSQQQAVAAQPNLIQNQPNLAVQQQFIGQNQANQPFPQQPVQQQQQQQPPPQYVSQQQQQPPLELLNQQSPQFVQQSPQQPPQQPQQGQFGQPQVVQQPQQRPQLNPQLWQQQQQQQQSPQQPPQQQVQQSQQQPPPQMTVRHPVNIVQQGPRLQWSPNQQQQQPNQMPQRQFIQLDAQTHHQLQKMPPDQQALFIARLQKQKQLLMQKQMQQQASGGRILIRGSVPQGLNPQQQLQWLQQQAKQHGVVLPPNIQQQTLNQQPNLNIQQQHAPGLSPIQQQQPPQFVASGNEQQIRQFRLQQLQLQREQAQKSLQQQVVGGVMQQNVVRPPLGPPTSVVADSTSNQQQQPVVDGNLAGVVAGQHQLVVNPKTKTALANMLSSRLQSGATVGPVGDALPPEPSAAGTLRLMTAQHNAALNPNNNRPQDILALQQQQQQQQQRRVINGPNGEIIRPPQPQGVPVAPHSSEPPKLQYSPRPIVPLQHRPGPFYGHNPNLKLPPDLFLLGCIFVVVEVERYMDESFSHWQQKIERHGGEIEKQYCNRVTHVLCETQRHGVVMQAIRDFKRCITIYWLSDVMKRKQVLPPWTALHLPAIYLDTTPASKHLIAQCGFEGDERKRVKRMISYTGAKFTSYISKHNTLVVAAKTEGPKYSHAKKWGTPVVNVQWLTDVMLGNFSALNQMEHIMYQQFQGQPNFSFDPKLVPNLMHGWKMPINISQESYERVKRSASPVVMPKKPKKVKLEQTDENDNLNDVEVNPNYRILFSNSYDFDDLRKIVRQLGGAVAKSQHDCTHLVMSSLARTNKLLFCLCRDVKFMPEQWLKDSAVAQKFLDESNYSLDSKNFDSEFKCDFGQTLAMKNRHKLFEGKFFWITPSVFPSKKVLVELVQSCGGMVEKIRRTSAQIEATNINSPYSYIIITHENDIHLVADLLKNKKGKISIVCSAELIFSAILKQTVEVEPFAVKVL